MTPIPKTILFADNAPDFLASHAEILRAAGYHVLPATSPAEAHDLLDRHYVHLALLDIRLEDDDNPNDVSGVRLAQDERYRSIPKIMLTGFPEYQTVREVLQPQAEGLPPAVDYVSKGEIDSLLEKIDNAFQQHVRLNRALTIHWGNHEPFSFLQLLTRIDPQVDVARAPDLCLELESLFRRLFFEGEQLTIQRLLMDQDGCTLLACYVTRPGGLAQDVIVLCGYTDQVLAAAHRYERFAPQARETHRLRSERTEGARRFAGVLYAPLERRLDEVVPLATFYRRHTTEEVGQALEHLYTTTFPRWHEQSRSFEAVPLLATQVSWLEPSPSSLAPAVVEEHVQFICRHALAVGLPRLDCSADWLTIHWDGREEVYPSPVAFLTQVGPKLTLAALHGVTHGQVTTATVLVDQEGQTWLAPLTRAEVAPLLRDFVLLELSVRLDLLETTDLSLRYQLEQRLLQGQSLPDALDEASLPPRLQKPLHVIQHIRRLAASHAQGDLPSYHALLWLAALAHLALPSRPIWPTRAELIPRAHSLLLAAMLCNALRPAKAERDLPNPAHTSLWLDEENKVAWVVGRQVELTPQEYVILAYLYHHQGTLCERQAIIEEALGEAHEEDVVEENRLNTAISRLRQKLEPDPAHPRYILTVRGHGYKLVT